MQFLVTLLNNNIYLSGPARQSKVRICRPFVFNYRVLNCATNGTFLR